MAKRKYAMTEAKIARYIKEGRGQGSGRDYKPWLTIHDFPSHGRVHRVLGWKTGRVHEFFSDIEYHHFLLLDWITEVDDIREQFPLDRDKTLEIARVAGIPHPTDPSSGVPIVMTTDLLVVAGTGADRRLHPMAVKPAEDLGDRRVVEKLEIEQRYWTDPQIERWHISTERELPMALIEALKWIRSAWDLADVQEPHEGYFVDLKQRLFSMLQVSDRNPQKLNSACAYLDERYGTESGAHLLIARHLFAHRVFLTDINRKKPWEILLRDIQVDEAAFRQLNARATLSSGPVRSAA